MVKRITNFILSLDIYDKLLLLIISISFIFKLLLIHQDINTILNKFLADDTYYYYSLVRNIIDGKGIVFNYGIPTNGFHPLYVIILIPLFKLLYPLGINAPVYASLILMIIFSIGTSIIIYLIMKNVLNKKAGLLAAFIWLFNPNILFVTLSAMETPIQIFFISLLTYYIVSKSNIPKLSIKESAIIGLLIGLIFLSRMDGVFIGIGVISALVLRNFKQNKLETKSLIAIISTASLTVVPWLMWSFIKLNRITPISGEALRILRLNSNTYPDLVFNSIYSTLSSVAHFFLNLEYSGTGYLSLFFFLFVPILILTLKRDRIVFKLIYTFDFLVISSIIYFLFYWFYEIGFRSWYTIYTYFLLTILFSAIIVKLIQELKPKKRQLAYILVIFILIFSFSFGGFVQYKEGQHPQEELKWRIGNYVNNNISPNNTIGSFNTGIYQYYTPKHNVINLDGVMNPKALKAMKKGNITGYMMKNNIAFIIDPPNEIEKLNKSLLNLKPVKTFEKQVYTSNFNNKVIKYKIYKISYSNKN
ncbi:hypothetical protein Metev_1244 [Methanohalobium evestigatum Z-7303]|uniref:Glycosyltransferase RgtA/B/C/D-like domain-containing protein n=1 Tax=Methanohalobium evestigatum (strain ATCC BAA-1072 / DSM 3721 / NBRC 107634 / OCM 161 / Z-7303) TaxID=644295 RepID=D7E7P0_METEZ|nr:glycosyltransferase family 39 protein [Methanohalobium evestigatum]ADI74113.1 hypothetical protein Metev_1244 [Methanohalobium evestigatum Z-7303]